MRKSSIAAEHGSANTRFAWILGGALLLAVVPFAAVIGAGFLGDDLGRVGTVVRHAEEPLALVRDRLLAPREANARYYRPVYETTFLVDHALFGLRAAGFHAVDVALHLAASVLAALLALRIWSSRSAALLAGLSFAWLPVHVESVAWIAARDSQLAVVFGGLAVWLASSPARGAPGWLARVCGALAFGVAYLSRESAAVVPAAVALVAWARAGSGEPGRAPARARARRAVAAVLPTAVVLLALTALRLHVLGGIGSAQQGDVAPPDLASVHYWSSRLDMLRLLVAPARGDAHGAAVRAALAAPALLLIALAGAERAQRGTAVALAAWLLLCLVPLHWSTVDPATLLDSRNLYEPSLPAVLLIAGGLAPALSPSLRRVRLGLVAALLAAHLGLLLQNLAIFRAAADVAARMQQDLLAVATRPPRAPDEVRVVEELPFAHRGVPVGSVLATLLAPPWIEREPEVPVAIFTRRDRAALVGSYLLEPAPSAWSRFVWDEASRALVELDRRPDVFVVRGRLDADGGRLRCLDRPLRIPADVAAALGPPHAEPGDDVLELRVRELADGSLHALAAHRRPAVLAVRGPLTPGAEIEVEVRTRPRASVVIAWPAGPTLVPVHDFGALLASSTQLLAQGFADGAGRFSSACRLPPDLTAAELRLQAVSSDSGGWVEISECVCARVD
jgi:hypothetical protein